MVIWPASFPLNVPVPSRPFETFGGKCLFVALKSCLIYRFVLCQKSSMISLWREVRSAMTSSSIFRCSRPLNDEHVELEAKVFGVSHGHGGLDLSSAASLSVISDGASINRCRHPKGTTLSVESHSAKRSTRLPPAVDNTDWLKAAAIVLVSVDHFGYFFMEDDLWWSAFGRLAAPIFFFLLGFAQARTVPLHWIWLGVVLTLLESWNADWTWVAPNILLSLALIRIARHYVHILVQHYGWAGFFLLVCGLLAVLPITSKIVDYGSEGWLWALCGLCQRMYVDGRTVVNAHGAAQNSAAR